MHQCPVSSGLARQFHKGTVSFQQFPDLLRSGSRTGLEGPGYDYRFGCFSVISVFSVADCFDSGCYSARMLAALMTLAHLAVSTLI